MLKIKNKNNYKTKVTTIDGYCGAKGFVIFKNGYQKNAPKLMCEVEITTDFGKPEWGAEPNKMYYVLKILSVEEIS